ncbi:MAG: FKBP-type peptidyl-prolyl cis-trans isomerase [Allomuricauda sp.]
MHYEGCLSNGQVFDSSYKRNQPIDFTLGIGQVIWVGRRDRIAPRWVTRPTL